MLKKAILPLSIFLLAALLIGCASKKEMKSYDPDVGKETMQTILGAMQAMGPAMESRDFETVKANFKVLEDSFKTMKSMSAPTGDQETWMRLNGRMIELSRMGQKASKEMDPQKIGGILKEMQEKQKEGHGLFQNY